MILLTQFFFFDFGVANSSCSEKSYRGPRQFTANLRSLPFRPSVPSRSLGPGPSVGNLFAQNDENQKKIDGNRCESMKINAITSHEGASLTYSASLRSLFAIYDGISFRRRLELPDLTFPIHHRTRERPLRLSSSSVAPPGSWLVSS